MDRSPDALEERSLQLHRAVAANLRQHPALLGAARSTLARWRATAGPNALRDCWMKALDQGVDATVATMLDSSEHGVIMRKASPFTVMLAES